MKIVKTVVGTAATICGGAAMTSHLDTVMMLLTIMAVVVLMPMLLLVFGVLRGKDSQPAERLTGLIRAWRSGDA
jgi:hypothetical protein